MSSELTIKDTEDFSELLWEFFESVPLGNSDFQSSQFVLDHCKNGRNYRQIVLEVKKEAINIKKEIVSRKKELAKRRKNEIEITKLKDKIFKTRDSFEKEILQCDVEILEAENEELDVDLRNRDVLVKDAKRRLGIILQGLKETGMYTREEFENEESEYWEKRLLNEARIEALASGTVSKGVLHSIDKMELPIEKIIGETKITTHLEQKEAGENKMKELMQKKRITEKKQCDTI